MVCAKLFSSRRKYLTIYGQQRVKTSYFSQKKNAPHLYRTFDDGFYKVFKKKVAEIFSTTVQKRKPDRNQTFFCKFTIFVGCIFNVLWIPGLTRGICFFI